MIDRILQLLGGPDVRAAIDRPDGLQVAVAALLVEAARMDDHFDEAERRTIERLLAERFALSVDEAKKLLQAAEQAVDQSTQLFRFTHLVVESLDNDERVKIIEMLWEVAYTDGALDPEEDALLRRIAGLIYVSDRERGQARKRVLKRLGHDN